MQNAALLANAIISKLPRGQAISDDSPEIQQNFQQLDEVKRHARRLLTRFHVEVRENDATTKEGRILAENLLDFEVKIRPYSELLVLGGALQDMASYQLAHVLNRNKLHELLTSRVVDPCDKLLKGIEAAKGPKSKVESAKTAYDAAIQKLQILKKSKNTKPDKIQLAEAEVETCKNELESITKEALEFVLSMNAKNEVTIIECLSNYLDNEKQFLEGNLRALSAISATFEEYRLYVDKRREELEAQKSAPPAKPTISLNSNSHNAATHAYNPSNKRFTVFGKTLEEVLSRDANSSIRSENALMPNSSNPPASSPAPALQLPSLSRDHGDHNENVPHIIRSGISWLQSRNAINEEGLFRVSSSKMRLKDTIEAYQTGKISNFDAVDDVCIITDLIKRFLRELPQPLLTYDLYPSFIATSSLEDGPRRIEHLQKAVSQLPTPNYSLVEYLFHYLWEVSKNSKVNKMTASNLATIFGPSILCPKDQNVSDMVDQLAKANSALAALIKYFPDIFLGGEKEDTADKNLDTPSSMSPRGPPPTWFSGSVRKKGDDTRADVVMKLPLSGREEHPILPPVSPSSSPRISPTSTSVPHPTPGLIGKSKRSQVNDNSSPKKETEAEVNKSKSGSQRQTTGWVSYNTYKIMDEEKKEKSKEQQYESALEEITLRKELDRITKLLALNDDDDTGQQSHDTPRAEGRRSKEETSSKNP